MKNIITLSFFIFSVSLSAQGVIGVWKTVDDVSGEATSHLEIYEQDGKLRGKIIKLLDSDDDAKCEACTGDKKNQPIIGMDIIWNMKGKEGVYKGGKILDPDNGKEYKCKITLGDDPSELDVRGYIGFSLLGRSQTWYRVN